MDDMLSADTKMIINQLGNHEERINRLEQPVEQDKDEKEQPEVKKMADGTMRRIR